MKLVLDRVGLRVDGEAHLYEIDLALEPGSLNLLLGPTLAGKTSLLRLMAGLDRPTSGRICIDGCDVTELGVRGRSVAMVYQQFVNYPSFTVYENIASPLRIGRRLGAAEIDRKVRAVAETMRIDGLLDRLPAELSGGQQQRTAIARALAKEAELLLLDEPLVNLDYKLREELRAEMAEIFARGRTTVVYATTEPAEALLLGGHTAVLDAGRLIQFGPTLRVYHRPATVRAGEIFSDPPMNLMAATIERRGGSGAVRLSPDLAFPLPGHMRALLPGGCRIGVRASHIDLSPGSPAHVAIPATVELAEISGSETFIHARHGDLALIAHNAGVHAYALGAPVTLYLDPRRLFAFDEGGRLIAAPDHEPGAVSGAA